MQSQDLIDAGHPSSIVLPLTTNLIDGAEPLRIRIRAGERLRAEAVERVCGAPAASPAKWG
ncbi:MAG: hypothetical protein M3P29_05610, partial [Acidobacteriota bacterium]|nr:hypothetical protein [Acidobacteriota bacterium]